MPSLLALITITALNTSHNNTLVQDHEAFRTLYHHLGILTIALVILTMEISSFVALLLVIVAVTLSTWQISSHLRHFSKPYLQKYTVRILLMVPIYSINAWVALALPTFGVYLDTLRECYEAFVIYSFMKYLLNFLHYDTNLQQYIEFKPGVKQLFPFCCLRPCIGGKLFLIRCKHGILQYTVIRPITAFLAVFSQLIGIYGDGNYNPFSGGTYPILLLINYTSQILAMYSLVVFYTGYKRELAPMKPLAKFLSIKLVIFFSFFQSVLIAVALEIPAVEEMAKDKVGYTKQEISRNIQNFLICFEMLLAAICHIFVYSNKPFKLDDSNTANRRDKSCCVAILKTLDLSDDRNDISEHLQEAYTKVKNTFKRNKTLPIVTSSDNDYLNMDESVDDFQSPVHANDDPINEAVVKKSNLHHTNYDTLANML